MTSLVNHIEVFMANSNSKLKIAINIAKETRFLGFEIKIKGYKIHKRQRILLQGSKTILKN